MRVRIVAAAVLASLAVGTSVDAGGTVGALSPNVKVRSGASVSTSASISMKAARNEFEAFQIVITADGAGLSGVSVIKPTLTLVGGTATIPASDVRVYRMAPITVGASTTSNVEGLSGTYYDALLPTTETVPAMTITGSGNLAQITESVVTETRNGFPVTLAANERAVAWIEVHAPTTATVGTYAGTTRVNSSSLPGGYVDIATEFVVRNFAIPQTSTLPAYMSFAVDRACNKHLSQFPGCSSNEHKKLNAAYARFMLEHRISISLADDAVAASSTNFNSIYAGVIGGTESPTIKAARQLPDAAMTALRYPWYRATDASTDRRTKATNWWNYVSANNWAGVTFDYTRDEPGDPDCIRNPNGCAAAQANWNAAAARAADIHSASLSFRTLVTSNITYANSFGSTSWLNLIVPVVNHMDDRQGYPPSEGNQRSNYDTFLAQNSVNAVWTYQSCMSHACGVTSTYHTNWPNVMIDATGVQNRAEPWTKFIYDAPGLLYYEIATWYDEATGADLVPLNSGFAGATAYNSNFTGNGDGWLVYPGTPSTIGGTTDVPVASYRLKMIRDGLEDYEYLRACKTVNPTRATQIARSVFPMTGTVNGRETGSMFNANNYNGSVDRDPVKLAQTLEDAREQLAACIENTETVVQTGSNGYDVARAVVAVTPTSSTSDLVIAGSSNGAFAGTALGGQDIVVQQVTATGEVVWSTQVGTTADDVANAVAVDASGSVYVAGYTSAALEPGFTPAGGRDAFVMMLSAGRVGWIRQLGSIGDDVANAVAVTSSGVFVAGQAGNALPGQTFYGTSDYFVAKYDVSGKPQWRFQGGSTGADAATSIAVATVSGAERAYIGGYTTTQYNGTMGIVLRMLGDMHEFTYTIDSQGAYADEIYAVTIAQPSTASQPYLYVTGNTGGALQGTSAGARDVFVADFEANLMTSAIQVRQIGSAADDVGNAIAFRDDAVYVAGRVGNYPGLRAPATSGNLPGQTTFGGPDGFLIKLSTTLTPLRIRQFGTTGNDEALGLATMPGAVKVVGRTDGAFPGNANVQSFNWTLCCGWQWENTVDMYLQTMVP